MADVIGDQKWMQMYTSLEKVMVEKKKIYPNLDFPAGPAYYMMGFEIDFFTPIFVMARTTGWSAHIMEQTANNRIIRPLSEYIGSAQRKVTSISEKKVPTKLNSAFKSFFPSKAWLLICFGCSARTSFICRSVFLSKCRFPPKTNLSQRLVLTSELSGTSALA